MIADEPSLIPDQIRTDRETFRDPSGSLIFHGSRVLRRIHPSSGAAFANVVAHPRVTALMSEGRVVRTSRLDAKAVPEQLRDSGSHFYEHEPIPFSAYPAEWPAPMLADAALFTLDLALELLRDGLALKDATPANVLYRGSRPVLVDVPSIVTREPGSFIWLARHQFETTFLLPLIASVEAGVPIAWSLADPASGLSHEALARLLGFKRWLKPGLIGTVALPSALGNSAATAAASRRAAARVEERKARFILERSLAQLRNRVEGLAKQLRSRTSHWQSYTGARTHYEETDLERKRAFVADALGESGARWVLDVGANTGEFSELASRHASVVAAEVDETSAGRIFERARAGSLDILSMVLNVARPTAGTGWRNAEARAFLDRARGRFDTVMMLAVIHHLRVGAGIPLAEVLALAAELTTAHAVIEFVPATDPMFVQIARGRDALYTDWTRENFEALLQQRFAVGRHVELANGRVLYLARRAT